MGDDAPDYTLKAFVDIIQQTLQQVSVDLAGQSVGNLATNIAQQDLAKITVGQAAAAPTVDVFSGALAGSATTTLYTSNTPAWIKGGLISVQFSTDHSADNLLVIIDGSYTMAFQVRWLYTKGYHLPGAGPMILSEYDQTNNYYSIMISRLIYYQTSLVLQWENIMADAGSYSGSLWQQQVTPF